MDMSPEIFNYLVDFFSAHGIKAIDLTGGGEFTVAPHWQEWCDRLIDLGISIDGTTNLAKVLSAQEIETLSKFSHITVSIDSFDPDILRTVRKSVDLRSIVYNTMAIRAASLSRESSKSFELTIMAVYSAQVVPGLKQLVSFASVAGAEVFGLQDLIEYPSIEHKAQSVWALTGKQALDAVKHTRAALDFAKSRSLLLKLPAGFMARLDEFEHSIQSGAASLHRAEVLQSAPLTGRATFAEPVLPGFTRNCFDPWTFVQIISDGLVRPCCFSEVLIGNLSDGISLGSILDSEVAHRLRRQLLSGDLDRYCSVCALREPIRLEAFHKKIQALVHCQDEKHEAVPTPPSRSAELETKLVKAAECIGRGALAQAQSFLCSILEKNPEDADGLHLMGLLALMTGQSKTAVSLIEAAISHRPHDSGFYSNCGIAYRNLGNLDRAFHYYLRAIELNPKNADAWCNYASGCRDAGHVDEAITSYRRAIALNKGHANAHHGLGLALLLSGHFSEGWREFEYRCNLANKHRSFNQERWIGQSLAGRTIFVHCEDDNSDTLQMLRYLPMLRRKGANVIFECAPELYRLISCLEDIQVILPNSTLPLFDYYIPLPSLPFVFGTVEATIPREGPYLRAPAAISGKWREDISKQNAARRIGICWSDNANDRNRSCQLSVLKPLGKVENAIFFNLQTEEPAAQPQYSIPGMKILSFGKRLQDFAETAGLIENLDLVVTVDTAVAHLAGALGRPVWLLLPFDPDWRWQLKREDSPWYPSMKLFRQINPQNWGSVSSALANAVAEISVSAQGIKR
jgi:tetratricopeptide (TPR) repeat protein